MINLRDAIDAIVGGGGGGGGFDDEGSAAPTTGAWTLGWRRRNTVPTAGGCIGWVNLTGGGCNFKEWGIINA
jgi:hypothetical protein